MMQEDAAVWGSMEDIELPFWSRYLGSEGFALEPEAENEKEWRVIECQIFDLRLLQDDWDGSGSDAPNFEIVISSLEFVHTLREEGNPAPSRAVPMPTGSILMEWQLPGVYAEAEIFEVGHAECMRQLADGAIEHWDYTWIAPEREPAAEFFGSEVSDRDLEEAVPQTRAA